MDNMTKLKLSLGAAGLVNEEIELALKISKIGRCSL